MNELSKILFQFHIEFMAKIKLEVCLQVEFSTVMNVESIKQKTKETRKQKFDKLMILLSHLHWFWRLQTWSLTYALEIPNAEILTIEASEAIAQSNQDSGYVCIRDPKHRSLGWK